MAAVAGAGRILRAGRRGCSRLSGVKATWSHRRPTYEVQRRQSFVWPAACLHSWRLAAQHCGLQNVYGRRSLSNIAPRLHGGVASPHLQRPEHALVDHAEEQHRLTASGASLVGADLLSAVRQGRPGSCVRRFKRGGSKVDAIEACLNSAGGESCDLTMLLASPVVNPMSIAGVTPRAVLVSINSSLQSP